MAATVFGSPAVKNRFYNKLFHVIEREKDLERARKLSLAFDEIRANRAWDALVHDIAVSIEAKRCS